MPAGPLKVVFHSPRGQVRAVDEIAVTFNQPMVRLGAGAEKYPVAVSPPVRAERRWVSGDTLKIKLTGRPRFATVYTVRIPKGTRAVSGRRLEKDFAWKFVTPRPALVGSALLPSKRYHRNLVGPADSVLLTFNQPVDPAEIRKYLTLSVNGKPAAFSAERHSAHGHEGVRVRPAVPFPWAATVEIAVRPGFRGMEGHLLADRGGQAVLGKHPALTMKVTCDGKEVRGPDFECWPMKNEHHDGLRVAFSTPVVPELFYKLVEVRPSGRSGKLLSFERWHFGVGECNVSGKADRCARRFEWNASLLKRTRYQVRVRPGLSDIYGQKLERPSVFRFKTRGLPPGIFLPRQDEDYADGENQGEEYVLEGYRRFRVKAVNVKKIVVRMVRLEGEKLVRFLQCERAFKEDVEERRGTEAGGDVGDRGGAGGQDGKGEAKPCMFRPGLGLAVVRKELSVRARPDQTVTKTIPLLPGSARGSVVAFEVSSPEVKDEKGRPVPQYRIINVTRLNVHARLTPYNTAVWVTRLDGGRPVSGANVELLDVKGKVLFKGRTSASGLCMGPGFAAVEGSDKTDKVPRVYVLVSKNRDLAYAEPARWKSGESDQGPDIGPGARGRGDVEPGWQGFGPHYAAFVDTERNVYRPGQTVHIFGVVRRYLAGKRAPLSGGTVAVHVASLAGSVLFTTKVKLDNFGAFTTTFELPRQATLGRYGVVLERGSRRVATSRFTVKHYRPPRFSTTVWYRAREVIRGQTALADLSGRFYSGGATARAGYRTVVQAEPASVHWSAFSGWRVGPEYGRGPVAVDTQVLSRGSGRLDKNGSAVLRIPTTGRKYWHAVQLTLEAEITDKTQSTAASRDYVRVHPSSRYVAVRPTASSGTKWNQIRVRVVVVDTHGGRTAGHTVEATVHPFARDPVPSRWKEVKGAWNIDWKRTLNRQTLKVPAAGAVLSFTYPTAYRHAMVVFHVTDSAGRTSRTDLYVTRPIKPVIMPSAKKVTVRDRWDDDDGDQLSVRLDRETYDPGQTAVVTVKSKRRIASAFLFVERERIFDAVELRFGGGRTARARIRVSEEQIGDVTLTAVAYPRASARDGKGEPVLPLTAGQILQVSEESLELDVRLATDKAQYRAGEKVTCTFRVADSRGKGRKAELMVMAVDEAVLRLTGFSRSSPHRDLFFVPDHQVTLDELRAYLMPLTIPTPHYDTVGLGLFGAAMSGGGRGGGMALGALAGSAGGWGGYGGGRKLRIRRMFETTPLARLVRSDADGKGRFTFTLPDNLTAFRIMAVAFDRGQRAGIARTVIQVDQPMSAIPTMPRFARVGDQFAAGVTVYNHTAADGTARVRADAKGVVMEGKKEGSVRVPRGESRTIRFQFRATRTGTARFRFDVRMGKERDALEHELNVVPVTVPEARAVAGRTVTSVRHLVDRLAGMRTDFGGLEVSMASTVLTGVQEGMDQLIRYPYGCLEQKASGLLPILAVIAFKNRFGITLNGKPETIANKAVAEILALQRMNGGFAYWPNSDTAYPWLTAYALMTLHRAMEVSIPVHPDNIRRAAAFLGRHLSGEGADGRTWPAARAFMVYALALHGYDIEHVARRMFTGRRKLPLFGQTMLLAAIGRQIGSGSKPRPLPGTVGRLRPGKGGTSQKSGPVRRPASRAAVRPAPLASLASTLAEELGNHIRLSGHNAYAVEPSVEPYFDQLMHSNDRTTALLLMALVQSRPRHPMVPRLAAYLTAGRRDSAGRPTARFRNTQEAAFSLMALMDYARIVERTRPEFTASVWLGSSRILTRRFAGRSLQTHVGRVPMAALLATAGKAARYLTFHKKGRGTLYFTARLRFARAKMATTPVSRGFSVLRRIVLLDEAGRPARTRRPLQVGDVVQVELIVRNLTPRRFVVVDDPLPAGFEAIDPELAVSSRLLNPPQSAPAGARWFSGYDHRELRDDRVVHFKDYMPRGTHRFRYLARVIASGRFLTPPARAEEMYGPEVYGFSGGRVVTVR